MKNQKGITLIALVVTIIVLLILAGVSIAMLTGENGILGRAKESSWKSKLADAEDIVALSVSNYWADYLDVKYTGANSTVNEDWSEVVTDEEATANSTGVIAKACEAAKKDLGGDTSKYAITYKKEGDENSKSKPTITITYDNGTYQVIGILDGSKVEWGNMAKVK